MTIHLTDGFGEPEALLFLPNGFYGGGTLHIPGTNFYTEYPPAKVALVLALQEARRADSAQGGLGWRNADGVLRLLGKDPGEGDPCSIVSRLVCDTNRPFRSKSGPQNPAAGIPRLIAVKRSTGYRLQYRLRIVLPNNGN